MKNYQVIFVIISFFTAAFSAEARDSAAFEFNAMEQSKQKILLPFPASNNSFVKDASLKVVNPVLDWENFSSINVQQYYYGAIAFSQSTGATGGSWDYSSEYSASSAAVDSCGRSDCRAIYVFWNTCGALAVGDGRGWGTGSHPDRYKAEMYARVSCRDGGNKNCQDYYWVCTTR